MGIMHPCNAPNLRPLCRGALPLFRHIALTGRRGLKTIETQRVLLRFNKGAAASSPRMITEFLPLFVCHNRLNTL